MKHYEFMLLIESKYISVDKGFSQLIDHSMDDGLGLGYPVEGDLREQVVFCLVLHPSHQNHPENVLLNVVSASSQLMVQKWHFGVVFEPGFSFMVANQYIRRVKPPNQVASQKVGNVLPAGEDHRVVGCDHGHVDVVPLEDGGLEGVVPPLEVEEGVEVHLVLVLDVLIVLLDVGEHVVAVVLGTPPFERKAVVQGGHHSAQQVEILIPGVGATVSHPPSHHLHQRIPQNGNQRDGSQHGSDKHNAQKNHQQHLHVPTRLEILLNLLVHLKVLNRTLRGFSNCNHWKAFKYAFCLIGMKGSSQSHSYLKYYVKSFRTLFMFRRI